MCIKVGIVLQCRFKVGERWRKKNFCKNLTGILMHSDIFGRYLGWNSQAWKVEGNEELQVVFKMLLFPNIPNSYMPWWDTSAACFLSTMDFSHCDIRNNSGSYRVTIQFVIHNRILLRVKVDTIKAYTNTAGVNWDCSWQTGTFSHPNK